VPHRYARPAASKVAPRSLCGASPGISVGAGRVSVSAFENAAPGLRQATPVLPGPYFDRFVHASSRCERSAAALTSARAASHTPRTGEGDAAPAVAGTRRDHPRHGLAAQRQQRHAQPRRPAALPHDRDVAAPVHGELPAPLVLCGERSRRRPRSPR
jgi:hypothetical protein